MKRIILVFCLGLAVSFFAHMSVAQAAGADKAESEATVLTEAANGAQSPVKVQPKESEIPLNIEAAKKTDAGAGSTGKIIFAFIILTTLAGGGFFFVRKYTYANKGGKLNPQIKILTQHYMGPKKSLAIIHVAGESILIGITEQNISMLKSLSLIDDEVPAEVPKKFDQLMTQDAEESYAFDSIKENISDKIKQMRTL